MSGKTGSICQRVRECITLWVFGTGWIYEEMSVMRRVVIFNFDIFHGVLYEYWELALRFGKSL